MRLYKLIFLFLLTLLSTLSILRLSSQSVQIFAQTSRGCEVTHSTTVNINEPLGVRVSFTNGYVPRGEYIIIGYNETYNIPDITTTFNSSTSTGAEITLSQPGDYKISIQEKDFDKDLICSSDNRVSVQGGDSVTTLPTRAPEINNSSVYIENNDYIDSNTSFVTIQFNNMPSDVLYCVHSFQEECENDYIKGKGKLLKSKRDLQGADGQEGRFVVCGDGDKKLNVNNCNEDDWFHAGSVYRMGAYIIRDDIPIKLALAEFYVYHHYPDVEIVPGIKFGKNIKYGFDDDPLGTLLEIKSPQDANIATKSGGIKNPLEVILSGHQTAGGDNRNNYQLVVEGVDNNFGNRSSRWRNDFNMSNQGEVCVTIPPGGISESRTIGNDTSRSNGTVPLPYGKYVLKINERINDSGLKSKLSRDDCQGGFTYYHIPFVVERDGTISFRLSDIEVDPNRSEHQNQIDNQELEGLPCSQWVDIAGEEVDKTSPDKYECKEYETAFGSFSTDPIGFIKTVGQRFLALATVAAFGYIIYAGYILMTSRGDKEKIAHAREILTSVITGFIFLILSITILEVIGVDILQIPGFTR